MGKVFWRKMRNQHFSDIAFMAVVYLGLTFALVACAYPVIYVVSASFSSSRAVASGEMWLFPKEISLEGYRLVFQNKTVYMGFVNSVFYVIMSVLIQLMTTMMAGFAFSRRELPGRTWFNLFFVITMFFGGGLIPTYLVYLKLGLVNTRWALLLPGISFSNIIIARTSISALPEDLFDCSKLDGCSYIRYLFRIVVPLSKPILAVFSLYTAVGVWNSYFGAMIYLRDQTKYPLQIFLRTILILNSTIDLEADLSSEDAVRMMQVFATMKYALIVVSTAPIICVYPFVQKHFVKGVMVGSLKG